MLFGPKHTFQDGNQWSYQIWPVQFVYGRTGHFEEFSTANTGSPLKKFNFQCTYFPGLYSYAVWTKNHICQDGESMVHTRFDLYSSCTAAQVTFEEFSIANYMKTSQSKKIQIPVHILPSTVKLCCSDQNTPFRMGINGTYQIWPVQFVHGRTGDFEV